MPYKKNFRPRKRYNRKRAYVNKTKKLVVGHGPTMLERIASGAGSVAKLAGAVAPIISMINTEEKFYDIGTTLTSLTSGTPAIACMSQMAQGVTEQGRIGSSILGKNLACRFGFRTSWATASNGSGIARYRLTIFSDKAQAGTLPTTAQLFQDNTNINLPMNRNFTDRFVIIKDKYITTNAQHAIFSTGSIDQYQFTKWFKKLDFHIRYIGTDATSASSGQNALYYCIWSVSDTNVSCKYESYTRLNYTDN